MNREALYTILYPFMSETLGLHGYEKETFAVIFGFWFKAGEKPVRASLSTIQKITGGTRPAIVKAITLLIKDSFIKAEKRPGKPTLYSVILAPEILTEFKANYRPRPVAPVNRQESNSLTTTGSPAKLQNKGNARYQNDTTLHVRRLEDITTGGLPEAK